MADSARVRRPVLDRIKPIRNWTTVVSPGPPLENPVGPGVQNANRVLEEYLRAGEASARLFQGATGNGYGGGTQDLTQRMVRAASDLMSFWFEFMVRSAGGMPPAAEPAAPNPQPAARAHEPSPVESLRVAVELDSIQPARVTVDVRQEARGSRLCLDRLHPRNSNAAPISGAEIDTTDDSTVLLTLHIDPNQPPGVYNGVILYEATSLPAGTVSVEVQPARTTLRPDGRQ